MEGSSTILKPLLVEIGRRKIPVDFFTVHPGVASLRGRDSEITRLLDRARAAGITVKVQKGVYNNWGGFVTNEDVRGLPIEIVGPNLIYKNGACVRLFTTVQVMATGIVNGCACRDANATLRLGDLKETPLRDLISSRNPRYMALIEQEQMGDFPASARAATCTRASITTARVIGRTAWNWIALKRSNSAFAERRLLRWSLANAACDHPSPAASDPTKAMRIMLVAPGVPSGTPATTMMRSPALAKPSLKAI